MKSNKKLMSCLLCLAIGLSIFLPCTALSVTASGLGFPAPVTVSAPKLLKEICVPDVNISLNGVSDAFSPELSGEVSSAAPVISGITSQVSPDSSVVIQGEGFSGGTVFVYGLNSSGEGVLKQAELLNLTDTSATALIDASFAYGMYFVWVRSASGLTSYPARINAPELTWISKTEAKPGSSVYVYGKNLSRQNLTANSYVYLTDGTDYYQAAVSEVNPYRVKITLPSNLENGNYKVWLHNGHGGQYGWSSSLDLTVNNQCNNIWSDTTITVASNTQEAILNAIHQASDYDTIYLPAGTYNITSTVNLCVGYPAPTNQQKALRFVGEGDGSQVKIVNQIKGTTEGSLFYITKLPSEFVNITFEEDISIFQGEENKAVLPSKFLYVNPYRNKERGYSNSGFRLNNCRFIQHRLITFSYPTGEDAEYDALLEKYNNPDAVDSKYCEGDWMDDMRIRKAQYTSYIGSYAAPVAISSAENVEITNCYFEGAQAVTTRGCLNVNVSNNTMMGKAIMYGNSGSNFMHTTHTDNIDISNNNIYGKDLITDPNGDLEEGDLTLCRTIVIQLPSGSSTNSYFADNDINRIGDNASNSGEHIMYECLGLHFMDKPASVSGVGGTTVTFNNTVWENRQETYTTGTYDNWYTTTYSRSGSGVGATDSQSSSYMGDAYAVITDGKGESQYRKITGFTTNSFTVDRPWDIVPDSTSTIAIVNAVENTVVYRNTIIGSNSFYLKYNASAGVQAYATMLDYIASENNFSNLYTGFFCNSHFNNKRLTSGKDGRGTYYSDIQSSGFNWFEDTLIYNNVITNTRRAVDVKLSYSADGDILDSSDILTVSHGAVVRSNTINTTRYGYNYNSSGVNTLEGIGGEGIAVGSLDKDYTVWGYNPLCPGDWLKDTLIENNDISDTVKSYIGLQYHQSNTVLRNNYCEGITDEKRMVWYNPLRSEIHPDVEKAIIYKKHGNAQDGITTLKANEIYDIICATEAPVNLDFSNGLKYWAPKADRTGSASGQMRLVTDSDGVTALTTLKTETDVNTQYNGIATVKFRADVAAGDRLYLLITWKNTSTSTYEAYPTLYQWDAEGNKTQASYTSLTANSSTAGKWNTRCVSLMDVVSDDSTFSLQVQETRTDGSTDPTIFFKRLQIVKPTASGTYVDLMTGNEIYADGQQAGGTATDGAAATYYNGDIRHFGNPYIENLYNTDIFGAVQGFNNGDFSNGLKYWSIREYSPSKAPQYTALSQQATVTAEGALKFNPVTCSDEWLEENPDNTNIYAGASSVPFMLPGVMAGDTVYLAFDARNCASQMRVRLYDDSVYASSGSSSYAQKFAINADSDWRSYISTALTVSSDSSVFFIELQKSDNNHTAEFDNFRIVTRNDDGTYNDVSTGELLYGDLQPFGGTEDDGIVSSRFNNGGMTSVRQDYNLTNTDYYNAAVGLKNPDFSQGFKYWSYRGYSSSKAPQYTKISQQATVDKTSGAVTFLDVSCSDEWLADNPDNTSVYAGISSTGFKLQGLSAGDVIYASCEIRNTAGRVILALSEHNKEMTAGTTRRDSITVVKNTNGGVLNATDTWITTTTTALTVTDPESWFSVFIQRDNTGGTQIKNFRIYKQLSDGTLFDITDGDPAWAGSEADGIRSSRSGESSTDNIAPVSGQINGDFSKGLKYWASTAKFDTDQEEGTVDHLYASEVGGIVTDANGNKYFQFDGVQRSTYCGIKTVKLSISPDKISVGDTLVVMFDYKGDKNVQVKFTQRYCSGTAASSNTMINSCVVVRAATEDNPWTTVATKTNGSTVAVSTATAASGQSVNDGDYVFMITAAVPSNSSSTCCIDNLRLVKLDTDGNYHEII